MQSQLHRYTPAQILGPAGCVGGGEFWAFPDLARLLERDDAVTYRIRAKQYKSHSTAKLMDFEERLGKETGRHRPGHGPAGRR